MVDLSGVDRKTLVERAKAIILTPKEEWAKIAAETRDQGDIFRGYVLPLAAIGPACAFVGGQVFGDGALVFSYRPSLIGGLITGVIQYALTLIGVFLLMFLADALAPKFNGQSNRLNAFKLVAYSATATWIAQAFSLIPQLGFFTILGLYSIYLFYVGARRMMKVPQDKAAGYTAVTFVCAIIGGFVLSLIVAPITLLFATLTGGSALLAGANNDDASGTVTIPGVGSIDVDKAEQFSKQMEDAANGKSPPVEAARMQELLPATIGAYQRSATQTMAMGALGSTAEGTYAAGDKTFTLRVADMSALGALAGLGSAMGIEQSREDENGYESTKTVDGQMQTEGWNKLTSSGKFSRMVANRFMVEAEGSADSVDQLKAAVATIDPGDLTDMVP